MPCHFCCRLTVYIFHHPCFSVSPSFSWLGFVRRYLKATLGTHCLCVTSPTSPRPGKPLASLSWDINPGSDFLWCVMDASVAHELRIISRCTSSLAPLFLFPLPLTWPDREPRADWPTWLVCLLSLRWFCFISPSKTDEKETFPGTCYMLLNQFYTKVTLKAAAQIPLWR